MREETAGKLSKEERAQLVRKPRKERRRPWLPSMPTDQQRRVP